MAVRIRNYFSFFWSETRICFQIFPFFLEATCVSEDIQIYFFSKKKIKKKYFFSGSKHNFLSWPAHQDPNSNLLSLRLHGQVNLLVKKMGKHGKIRDFDRNLHRKFAKKIVSGSSGSNLPYLFRILRIRKIMLYSQTSRHNFENQWKTVLPDQNCRHIGKWPTKHFSIYQN